MYVQSCRGVYEMDETDVKIMELLTADARLSSRQIARQLGISVGTVLGRIKRMERAGVIKRYSAVLNNEKLGYELTVVTEILVSKGKLLEMEREIANWPNVCCVYDVTGEPDAFVIAKFHNREELSAFTKRLLSLPLVERTNTHLVLTTVKEDLNML
jgi:DNA-binding Lrp family transcriptional regulator